MSSYLAVAALTAVLMLTPFSVAAPQHAQGITGTVQRDVAGSTSPVANVWVVLHRVARDSAAAVDSVRSDARGRYALHHSIRDDSAVFFTATVHGGVAYFAQPFRGVDGPADDGVLVVYDTSSSQIVRTRGRHIIVSMVDSEDRRNVVEVFELENEGPRTRVASAHAPGWSTRIPLAGADVHIEQGDIAADAITVDDDLISVMAPIPPGLRQVVFSYAVHASSFPLALTVVDSTSVIELLLEDPGGRAEGGGLSGGETVNLAGRAFVQFGARDVPAGAVFVITVPPPASRFGNVTVVIIVGLVGVLLLLAIARAALGSRGMKARPGGGDAARAMAIEAERLARAIADLDDRFERRGPADAAAKAAYRAERAELDRKLNDVLAERDEQF